MRAGQMVVVCVVGLLTLGVVMVNSAGMTVATRGSATTLLLGRSTIYMGLALLALGLVAWLAPVRRFETVREREAGTGEPWGSGWRLPGLWLGVLGLVAVVAVVYLPGLGSARKGQSRWVEFRLPGVGELTVQPSEIAKWGLVVLIAWYAAVCGRRLESFWRGALPGLVAAGVVAAAVALADLGTAVLMCAVAAAMLVAAGARLWHLALMLPAGALAFGAAVLAQPYRLERITSFLRPYEDPQGKGYHMIQSLVAIANGEVWGRGLGNGLQKFGYLPEDTTDFVFSIVCEELGLFGAVLVLCLYGGLVWAGVAIARRQPGAMLKLLALGVVATVGVQAVINLMVVTGLAPTKGIALPLVSSGGTGWILTAASLGLLVAMDRLHAPDAAHERAADASGGLLVALSRR